MNVHQHCVYFLLDIVSLVIITSAIHYLERFASEMTQYVAIKALNHKHSITF